MIPNEGSSAAVVSLVEGVGLAGMGGAEAAGRNAVPQLPQKLAVFLVATPHWGHVVKVVFSSGHYNGRIAPRLEHPVISRYKTAHPIIPVYNTSCRIHATVAAG